MGTFLDPADLEPFKPGLDPAQAAAMIEDAEAWAIMVAPCITSDTFTQAGAVKAILRSAILRWLDAGSGALASRQQGAGPFQVTQSFDTRQERRGLFWPSDITALQQLCTGRGQRAFGVDTTPSNPVLNPLQGTVINAGLIEPMGTWADEIHDHVGEEL